MTLFTGSLAQGLPSIWANMKPKDGKARLLIAKCRPLLLQMCHDVTQLCYSPKMPFAIIYLKRIVFVVA